VTDASGQPITDLKGSDVVLRQGASHCLDVTLDPIKWPTRLTVMLDNGVKMADSIGELRSSLRAFFREIPDGIELAIITLAPQPRWLVRSTANRDGVMKSIELITPDHGGPRFLDSLMEAADRIDKEKTDSFPVIVAIVSDLTEGSNAKERDVMRMLDRLESHPVTVHVVMLTTSGRTATRGMSGQASSEVGSLVAKNTGGEYDAINSTTRLASLLPELAHKIARSYASQTHQYQVGCNRWDGAVTAVAPFTVGVSRPGAANAESTTDGHLP
jgi:hypothetical protein